MQEFLRYLTLLSPSHHATPETNMYLTQALHRAVQQHPQRLAVRFGNCDWTFTQFQERVARLAGALQQMGMWEGDRVAMLVLNSDRYHSVEERKLGKLRAAGRAGKAANARLPKRSSPFFLLTYQIFRSYP